MHRSNANTRSFPNARTPPPPIDPKKGIQGSAPPGETAAEKVARLRRARLQERAAQVTTWDRVVVRGRVWADRAHKVTVLGLVGFSSAYIISPSSPPSLSPSLKQTNGHVANDGVLPHPVVAAAITGFALTDMILHNRRKRAAFYAEQHALYAQRLIEAIEAERSGNPLDDDQTLVLNRERARVQAEEAAGQRTWRKRIKGVFVGGLKSDEEGGERAETIVVPSEGEILQKLGVDQTAILQRATMGEREAEGREEGSRILRAVEEKRREGERVMDTAGVRGGPLDQMAEGALQAVGERIQGAEEKVGSRGTWSSWWTGK